MSNVHEIKCDFCGYKVEATYNGEHWLAPEGWAELADVHSGDVHGLHICKDCIEKAKRGDFVDR